MNVQFLIDRLSQAPSIISALLVGVTTEQARWKPAPDKWSMLEVINHLDDEERDDFRQRLDLLLHQPGQPPPPIDPPRWAIERKYNERDLGESLQRFLCERQKSLDWLRSLQEPNWNNTHQFPHGPIQAGDLLASWAAHDLLHIRQLTRLHFEYLRGVSAPFKTEYAGQW